MVTGAVIAGATDLNYSMAGIVYVAVCAVSTAVYLLLIRLLKDKTGGERLRRPCSKAKFEHYKDTSSLTSCWLLLRSIAVSAALLQQRFGFACYDELHADNHK